MAIAGPVDEDPHLPDDSGCADEYGFTWLAWASEAIAHDRAHLSSIDFAILPRVQIGDHVWVKLGSNRGCRGIVDALASQEEEALTDRVVLETTRIPRRRLRVDGKGRHCCDVTVRVDDESEVACGIERLTQVFAAEGRKPYVVVVADTLEFRHLARTQVASEDRVVEIGSSTGLTTAILQNQAASAIGFDVSMAQIAEARCNHPECKFEFLDLFSEPHQMRNLPEVIDCNMAFVDIGGDREVSQVLEAIRLVREHLPPLRLVVVKSEELFYAMNTWGFNGLCDGAWQLRAPAEFLHATHASRRRAKQVAPRNAIDGEGTGACSEQQQKKKKAYVERQRIALRP